MRSFDFLVFLLIGPLLSGAELTKIPNCRLIPTEWADGDSFSVRLPDGKEQTIRLYGGDCIEIHVRGDDSNARRLRDQRRYFGIDDILVAKSMGETAKAATLKKLAEPFTIHTSFADGRGDGRFSRVYAFVVTADGEDLTEWLVSQGLARAFGVVRQLPDGTRGNEWREQLADLELTAARAARGAWARTDWEKLPEFRKQARDEIAELEAAKGNKLADASTRIDPNTAARDELMSIPGIGERTADAIIEGRPYENMNDLLKATGIGPALLKKIEPFVEFASPNASPKS